MNYQIHFKAILWATLWRKVSNFLEDIQSKYEDSVPRGRADYTYLQIIL